MAKVSDNNPPTQPQAGPTQTQGANPQNLNNPGAIPLGANIFSLGFSVGQPNQTNPPQNVQRNQPNQPGNSVFIRAMSTDSNNNISQSLNSILGNLMGMNPMAFNQNNQNPGTNNQPNQNSNAGTAQPNPQPQQQNRPILIPGINVNFQTNAAGLNNAHPPQTVTVNNPLINNPSQPTTNTTINSNNSNQMEPPRQTQPPPCQHHPQHQTQSANPNLDSPNQYVLGMALLLNRLNGVQAQFPGPVIPRAYGPNVINALGNYLYNYQFQLLRASPYLSRLSDLLIREQLLSNPQDRAQLQHFAHEIGDFLEETILATRPLVNLLRNVSFGDSPGVYRVVDLDRIGEGMFNGNGIRAAGSEFVSNNLLNRNLRSVPPNVNVSQNTQQIPLQNNNNSNNPTNNNQQGVGEISISFAGIEINNENLGNNNANPNQNQAAPNLNPPNGMNILNAMGLNNLNLGGLLNNVLGGIQPNINQNLNTSNNNSNANPNNNSNQANLNRPTTVQQPATSIPMQINATSLPNNQNSNNNSNVPPINSQSIPQNNNAPAQNNGNSQPPINFAQNMMPQNMLQNVMDYTLRDLIMENYANQLEGGDEEMLTIFGNLRIGEVVTAVLSKL